MMLAPLSGAATQSAPTIINLKPAVMLTNEEKEWCHQMLIALRIKEGAQQTFFSRMMILQFNIDLN